MRKALTLFCAAFLFISYAAAEAGAAEEYIPANILPCTAYPGENDTLIYYLYRPTCPYCAERAGMLLGGLPDEIYLPDGTVSRVLLVGLNKSDATEGMIISEFYEDAGIEKERQVVPAVLIGDTYLAGSGALKEQFLTLLLQGEGRNTPLMNGDVRSSGAALNTVFHIDDRYGTSMMMVSSTPWLYDGKHTSITGYFGSFEGLSGNDVNMVYRMREGCCGEDAPEGIEVVYGAGDSAAPYPPAGAWVRANGVFEEYLSGDRPAMRLSVTEFIEETPPEDETPYIPD